MPNSWVTPVYTANVNVLAPLRLLEAIRLYSDRSRFYQASSSEIYGKIRQTPQDEESYHHPRSPYAVSKSFGFNITRNYRESYGLFAANGILFNHESERRGLNFVTRKISHGVALIHHGPAPEITLGNLDAKRDWGYAPDYVEAMRRILAYKKPDEWVVARGTTRSVREFVERAFRVVGIAIKWKGKGTREIRVDSNTGTTRVRVSKEFFRPAEVDVLRGDAGRAKKLLGWEPQVTFNEMVERMVRNDIERVAANSGP